MAITEKRTYIVEGMTCGHCKTAVIGEIERVDGIAGADVELETGRVTVRGERLSDEAVAQAVGEAGYRVVGPR